MKNYLLSVCIILLSISKIAGVGVNLMNVDCGPHIDYVDVDPDRHRYHPYVVEVHRCHGSNLQANPQNRKCVPKNITGSIKSFQLVVLKIDEGAFSQVPMENHTRCEEMCILNETSCNQFEDFTGSQDCSCKCKYETKPSISPCPDPFLWDQNLCDCKCPHTTLQCPKKKEFDKETCSCACKTKFHRRCSKRKLVVSEDDCSCVEPVVVTGAAHGDCNNGITGGVLAVIMVIEAFSFLIAYFVFYVYCYKKRYLTRKASKYTVKDTTVPTYGVADNTHTVNSNNMNPSYNSDKLSTNFDSIDEERSNASRSNGLLYSSMDIYPDEEKSPLAYKTNDLFMYHDVEETSSYKVDLDPPSYSEYLSECGDEEGYASVTQV